jgi:hypothetical protein
MWIMPESNFLPNRMACTVSVPLVAQSSGAHHVELLIPKQGNKPRRSSGIICIVAIDDDISVGLDIRKHTSHYVPLTLHVLEANDRTRGSRCVAGAITRIIVVDIDDRFGRADGNL